jgi:transketolase
MTLTTEQAEQVDHQLAVDTIRTLAIDGVQAANSGHPGAPMGMAPMAYVLWTRYLRHAPSDPRWPDRDRFVLSAGHASMLLYALLHLTGYDLPIEELRRFRQYGSRTPGHPEFGVTPGVDATTGPLGQGFANAVGMAIAERRLAAEFNRGGHTVVDHWTYGICSDGDLQEGITAEAASLAGHLGLGKLLFLYDDNQIQLDGPTSWAWSEDVLQRFDAYGWDTRQVADGNDLAAIGAAIEGAREDPRPSLIAVRTVIGYGSPAKAGTQKAHGSPLGPDEVHATKKAYGWDPELTFHVPDEAALLFRRAVPRGEKLVLEWQRRIASYAEAHPELARAFERRLTGDLADEYQTQLPSYSVSDAAMGTRNASQAALQALGATVPELFGGAADLSESNLTDIKGGGDFSALEEGRNLRFGVREHAMGGIANGIAYHGGFLPYVATFLNFSDYMRGSVRLAALSRLRVSYVWTHDSVGLGEDGPTHQPIEHYAALRAMPNLWFIRPGDPNETIAAWRFALEHRDGPVALALTRQKIPVLEGTQERAWRGMKRGGYVLADAMDPSSDDEEGAAVQPDLILIATGSELHLAMAARTELMQERMRVRVVSMPCWEQFAAQSEAYRQEVLPPACTLRLSIEAGTSLGWERWVGSDGAMLAIERFGASAPAEEIFRRFGFTAENVAELARGLITGDVRGIISPDADHIAPASPH